MEVNVRQAIKIFFAKSAFEMIYMEAFANALDAGATRFNISVSLPDPAQLSGLTLTLEDNGKGFTDRRYAKFSRLLDVEEKSHKGLGRLVYLCYFDRVDIVSHYDSGRCRTFTFCHDFDSSAATVETVTRRRSGSSLTLTGFNGEKLSRNANIRAAWIKRLLLENFMMRFHEARRLRRNITVSITSKIGGKAETETFDVSSLPRFKVEQVEATTGLFDTMEVYYHISDISDDIFGDGSPAFVTALSIDDRSFPVDLLAGARIPERYNMIFLLRSSALQGATDGARIAMRLPDTTRKEIITIFRRAVYTIISREVVEIAEANRRSLDAMQERYPHLAGMIDPESVGYIPYHETIRRAQEQFFRTERELLDATTLTDEQLQKSIEFSSRTLAAYILYRQKIIERMQALSQNSLEADLHNLLLPRYHPGFSGSQFERDAFLNNLWVLDDRFMTYEHALSEAEMQAVIARLNPQSPANEADADADRPDIAIFFSRPPEDDGEKFDIVIVELKRPGITTEANSIVEVQLDKRTQALSAHYGHRIQRAWYYGIVEMTDDYRMHLKNNQYRPLFSHGNIYYKTKPVYRDLDDDIGVVQHSYIIDYRSLVADASARNSAFLRLLREKFSHVSGGSE